MNDQPASEDYSAPERPDRLIVADPLGDMIAAGPVSPMTLEQRDWWVEQLSRNAKMAERIGAKPMSVR